MHTERERERESERMTIVLKETDVTDNIETDSSLTRVKSGTERQ
jgi:hypothetical protein